MTMLAEARFAHPVVSALGGACAGVREAAEAATFGLADDELAAVVGECEVLRALTHHLQLSMVREADGRNLAGHVGASSLAAWLTGQLRLQPRDARRLVRLAEATGARGEPLDYAANVGSRRTGRELIATGAALAEGAVSPEHVAVVANVMAKIPTSIGIDEAALAEEEMAGFCREFDPGTVAKLGELLLEMLTGDTLDDEEGERHRLRYLSMDESTGKIRGQLTREQLAMLRTALDPLAAPSPAEDGTPDLRTPGQRLADALAELARRAISADMFENNHGMSHRVMVTIELGALAHGHRHRTGPDEGTGDDGPGAAPEPGMAEDAAAAGAEVDGGGVDAGAAAAGAADPPAFARPSTDPQRQNDSGAQACALPTRIGHPARPGELQWGGLISAEAVRLIACHASIQRVVLDPAGAVLDVGRAYRTVTAAQYAALIARDRGCAFPGCTRPPGWCIAHHCKHWINGGATDLDNLVMLCGHHHRMVHHGGWDVYIDPHDRLPTFIPPGWIDPDRARRRTTRPRPDRPGNTRRAAKPPDR